ncbi:MAG: YceI family protein [Polyangiaceae bacterium]|nr:YceI family protein [Polyangiaceae bacterium]
MGGERIALITVIVAALGASAACASPPEAVIGARAPEPVAPKGAVETYELSAAMVSVETDVRAGSAYTIKFPRSTGRLELSPDVPEASSFDIQIDATSAEASWQVVADIARDQFLHVGQFPEARFTSRSLRKGEEGNFVFYGTLVLHGTSQSLSAPMTLQIEPCRVQGFVEFSIDRRSFGVISDGGLDGVVSDTVVVRIGLDVPRKKDGKVDPACAKAPPKG